MEYVAIGLLVILVIAAGAFMLKRAGATPYDDGSDAGGSSPLGDTTEHSDVSSAAESSGVSRRG